MKKMTNELKLFFAQEISTTAVDITNIKTQ